MSLFNSNSTKIPPRAGSAIGAVKYDAVARSSELVERTLLQDYTFVATVLEVNQQLQVYRLRIAGLPDMFATTVDTFGKGVGLGMRASSMYGVGTKVLAMTTPALGVNQGVILGALATHLGVDTAFGSPELTVSSPVGSFKDEISDNGLLNCTFNNFNGGRPVDVYPGDTTILNTLGAGLVIGPLQASLISGLDCSVELHYIDSLVRVSSFNYEHNTAGAEALLFADSGDYTELRRSNPYVLESLGGKEQYGAVPKIAAVDRSTGGTAVTGKYKPELEEQIGWWRHTDITGHLANLKLAFVTAPLEPEVRTATTTEAPDEVGLFREHVDVTGAYSVVSAKSLTFIKDCFIPVPKERYRPDDSRGDKAAAITTARAENEPRLVDYTVTGADENTEHAAILYSAASSDYAAFKTHRSLVNFRERPTDWTFWEIDEIDLAGFKEHVASKGLIAAADGVSKTRMFAKLPKIGKLKINAKEEVKYFASRSMILMHEDGSIHIQDGYGSTISMRAGSIDLSCPGDITLRPGKNLVAFAGDTCSLIAGNDVELTSNLGDVRVQADRNVAVLAGNDGAGGILLETKAVAAILTTADEPMFLGPNTNANAYKGIWLKAQGSAVSAVAQEVYLGNRTDACRIYLDSGATALNFMGASCLFGAKQTTFVTNLENPDAGTNVVISDSGMGVLTKGSFLLQSSSFLASGKDKDIQLLINGSGFFSKSVMASSYAGVSTEIGKLNTEDLKEAVKTVVAAIQDQADSVNEFVEALAEVQDLIDESVVGAADTSLKNLTFCHPDSPLRGIPDSAAYVMFESDWQQQYRNQKAGVPMIIRGVDTSKLTGAASSGVAVDKSYCWPGAQALAAKFGKLESTSRYIDDQLRFKKEGFENPVVLTAEAISFEDNYTIIAKNGIRSKE